MTKSDSEFLGLNGLPLIHRSIASHMLGMEIPPEKLLEAMVSHIIEQEVTASGEEGKTQHRLGNALEKSYGNGELAAAFKNCYMLGEFRGSLKERHLAANEKKRKKKANKLASVLPLKARQYHDRTLKKLVQGMAMEIWLEDYDELFRISDVTELLMENLPSITDSAKTLLKAYLEEASPPLGPAIDSQKLRKKLTIRKWVAEVAPPHAKKRGRPRKNK